MNDDPTLPSYGASSKTLEESIAEANQDVTHANFVAGVQSGTMGFKCILCEPNQLIRGPRKTVFSILVILYTAAPFVLVPLWAWHERDWWLLLGIAASAIATRVAARLIYNPQQQNFICAVLLIAFVGSWLSLGFHSHCTFYTLSALWGFMLFMIADSAEKDYASQSLVESSDLFDDAIAENRIMIVRR